jgi:hypothetical protein
MEPPVIADFQMGGSHKINTAASARQHSILKPNHRHGLFLLLLIPFIPNPQYIPGIDHVSPI